MIQQKRTNDSFILVIDKEKRKYPIQELPLKFIAWNLKQRITALQQMLAAVGKKDRSHHTGGGFGAHLPVYITNNPKDKLFSVNAANKGTGFVAKDEYLDFYLDTFQAVYQQTETSPEAKDEEKDESIKRRIKTILEFYEHTEKIDLRCLAGLEIWPGNTAKNFIRDPRVSLHFLGMPSSGQQMQYTQWQVNAIWEKIDHTDKRFQFGVALRQLTMGHVGRSFVPGHIPTDKTPIKGNHPFGWILWTIEALDKSIAPIH